MKNVVVFGAGLVAKPGIRYLLDKGFNVTVASRTVSKAEAIVDNHPNGKAVAFDITKDSLEDSGLIQKNDLAVSLLPYAYHPDIAKACIKNKKHMATTSYVSTAMKELDEDAKKAGILIMNECGVDPGTDHMSAMRVIHDVKGKGGKITSFRSITGGLPAPDSNDNPMGYKFSWSPKGVILAGTNAAQYLEDSKVVDIKSGDLFNHHWPMTVEGMDLEAYPNRDSLQYIDLYGLKGIQTMFRGTFRYPGWCETLQALFDLGLMDQNAREGLEGMSWKQLMQKILNYSGDDIKREVATRLGKSEDAKCLSRLEWLGLFSDKKLPAGGSYLDVLSDEFLITLGGFKSGEQDMIIMLHEFKAEYPDGKKETITSTLLDFGIPNGDSSMARTVSLPVAIAVRMMLEGKIKGTGVIIPTEPNVYNPILDELETMNIVFKEKVL
ncbi:MAG TPA: saccharopine dehydrogenase C-terminal domain-containing protein [candidate division Zixibacteria bacterium]|nr:saccharopine dehydrogenase C-terminal domain-containing protein [candidate division Zixibacteria bacterium]